MPGIKCPTCKLCLFIIWIFVLLFLFRVFIEAPCGVGFSYSSTNSDDDYKHDDASTAADNYALIQEFFNRFPDYRQNRMFISSESYGGHCKFFFMYFVKKLI